MTASQHEFKARPRVAVPPGHDPTWSDLHHQTQLDGAIVPYLDRINAAGHRTVSSCQGGYSREEGRPLWHGGWSTPREGWRWCCPHLAIHTNTIEEAKGLVRDFVACFTRVERSFGFGVLLHAEAIRMDWSADFWLVVRRDLGSRPGSGMSDVMARAWWETVTAALCSMAPVEVVPPTEEDQRIPPWESTRALGLAPRNPTEEELEGIRHDGLDDEAQAGATRTLAALEL